MAMSVARALSELKLIDKRIEQKISSLLFAGTAKAGTPETEMKEFKDKQSQFLQSVNDLISRRAKLKAAIVHSNAVVTVSVGKESMTVAAAIERKSSIELEKSLLKRIREAYFSNKQGAESHNASELSKANSSAERTLGESESSTGKSEEYLLLVDAYMKKNQVTFVAIDNAEQIIESMQDRIDSFESEVDHALSESNVITMIEV